MELAIVIVLSIGCFIVGFMLGRHNKSKTESLGVLQLDHSDPDMPYLFLLNCDLDFIATKKRATFDVKVENVLSQD